MTSSPQQDQTPVTLSYAPDSGRKRRWLRWLLGILIFLLIVGTASYFIQRDSRTALRRDACLNCAARSELKVIHIYGWNIPYQREVNKGVIAKFIEQYAGPCSHDWIVVNALKKKPLKPDEPGFSLMDAHTLEMICRKTLPAVLERRQQADTGYVHELQERLRTYDREKHSYFFQSMMDEAYTRPGIEPYWLDDEAKNRDQSD